MRRDLNDPDPSAPPSKRVIWIIGAVLVVLLAIIALQGVVRGTGEAVGVDGAAPGGANNAPTMDPAGADR
jgi:hypothetical protein